MTTPRREMAIGLWRSLATYLKRSRTEQFALAPGAITLRKSDAEPIGCQATILEGSVPPGDRKANLMHMVCLAGANDYDLTGQIPRFLNRRPRRKRRMPGG